MSSIAVNWALLLRLPSRTSSAKALLLVMSHLARPTMTDKLECFPSVGYLVKVTGQNRKTIIANIDKLERWGLLSDTAHRMGVTRQVIVYRLHMREKICTRIPHSYSHAKKRRPKTDGKTPENCPKASLDRDTDKNRSFYKKSSSAHPRAHAPVRTAAGASAHAGAGEGRKQAMAEMADLIAAHRPKAKSKTGPPINPVDVDPHAGGAA
jgi:hypothetical protein